MSSLNASFRPPNLLTPSGTAQVTYDSAFAAMLGRVGAVPGTFNYNASGQALRAALRHGAGLPLLSDPALLCGHLEGDPAPDASPSASTISTSPCLMKSTAWRPCKTTGSISILSSVMNQSACGNQREQCASLLHLCSRRQGKSRSRILQESARWSSLRALLSPTTLALIPPRSSTAASASSTTAPSSTPCSISRANIPTCSRKMTRTTSGMGAIRSVRSRPIPASPIRQPPLRRLRPRPRSRPMSTTLVHPTV